MPALPGPTLGACGGRVASLQVFTPLVLKCKQLNRAMRIGTNHGSLSARILSYYGDTPRCARSEEGTVQGAERGGTLTGPAWNSHHQAVRLVADAAATPCGVAVRARSGMVESAFEFADICRKHDYHNFVFSMKASNPLVMVQVHMRENNWAWRSTHTRAAWATGAAGQRGQVARSEARPPCAPNRRRTACWPRRCTTARGTTPCTWASRVRCPPPPSLLLLGTQPSTTLLRTGLVLTCGGSGPCLCARRGGRGRGRAHEERHWHWRAAAGRARRHDSRVPHRGPRVRDRPLQVRARG